MTYKSCTVQIKNKNLCPDFTKSGTISGLRRNVQNFVKVGYWLWNLFIIHNRDLAISIA